MTTRRTWTALGGRLAWIALAGVMLYPLVWMTVSSFKGSNVAIFGEPFSLPGRLHPANYAKAVRAGQMDTYFINSLWVTGLSVVLVLYLGLWSGYALSKATFPGRRLWLALFLVGMILPVQAYLIPLVQWLGWLGIHDSLWALILPYTAQSLPVAVLLFSAYFTHLPGEIEDAARLDGAGTLRFYLSILMPTARPVSATVVVLTVLNTWNEFLMALLFIVDPRMKTLPVGMIAFEQSHNTDYPALLAGLTLISMPTLLLYAVFHRQVMRGVMTGAVR
jgi:raffinose/stachyose/melibiose transport system permease protein